RDYPAARRRCRVLARLAVRRIAEDTAASLAATTGHTRIGNRRKTDRGPERERCLLAATPRYKESFRLQGRRTAGYTSANLGARADRNRCDTARTVPHSPESRRYFQAAKPR